MTVVAVVQARMGSTRLPGKVAMDLAGRPMLQLLLERLRRARRLDRVVVATSDEPGDDPILAVAAAAGVPVVRGPERDVLERFRVAVADTPHEHVVRLTGDCPFLDAGIVDAVVDEHLASGADYTSNTLVRTYPDGLDVEVLRREALETAATEANEAVEREHVTPYVYRRPERFRLRFHRGVRLLGDERWTVDTREDLDALRATADRLGDPVAASWTDVLAVTGERADRGPRASRVATAADEDRLLAWRNAPDAVAMSASASPVAPADHRRWFERVLTGGPTRIWIAEEDGAAVGQVRVDVRTGVGEVSVTVAPEARGRGIAGFLLAELERRLAADVQVHRLTARVRPDNEASVRVFDRAGFGRAGTDADGLLRLERAR